jgi:2-polyprenyl-6-methoxyphenol hydroxylase-like FAD-dependent oxidoreductase
VRVACIGGGPGGLFIGLLLCRTGQHTVDVFDRTPEDATYGFGVVLSRMSVARLRAAANDVMVDILSQGVRWQSVEARYRGAVARSSGHDFGAVERRAMLRVLRTHATKAGVRISQPSRADALGLLKTYDLVVAADGAGSTTRTQLADHFRPAITHGTSRYVWFGVDRAFDCMTFLLADARNELLGAHVYPYSATQSTFLVEAPEQVWREAGFTTDDACPPGWTDERLLAYCQQAFESDLKGARLIGNGSHLLSFADVSSEQWSAPRVVMLGDAAHTAHFSVGSGTSMAMEDAAELSGRLSGLADIDETSIAAACRAYEAARRPVVRDIQLAAWASRQFWEQLNNEAHRGIDEILLRLLTRTGQSDVDLLRRIDPGLPVVTAPGSHNNHCAGETSYAAPLGQCSELPGETPIAALVRPHEIEAMGMQQSRQPHWSEVALVVDCDSDDPLAVGETAAYLTQLRTFAQGVSVGVFHLVRTSKLPQVAVARVRAFAAALCKLVPLDFMSIGCTEPLVASRIMQMRLCEFVRSDLGVTSVYACLPAYGSHARTHVEAARADRIWLLRGLS